MHHTHSANEMLAGKKTSVSMEPELWRDWVHFVLDKTGSARKASEELQIAMREYMAKHKRGK